MRAQLASAKSGQPDRAAIAALTRQQRSNGCGGTRFGANKPACSRIDARLRAARRGTVNRGQVATIMRKIRQNCGTRQARRETRSENTGVRRSAKSGRNIFSSIFGRRDEPEVVIQKKRSSSKARKVERVNLDVKRSPRTTKNAPKRSLATGGSGRRKGSSREGSSRTMCVRLCDGFYFPINSRSHSDNYYDEMAMCVGRCPGSDVSLYVHYSGEPVERMRSAMTGEAYVNLPTAFDYRKTLSPSCGCSNGTRIARGNIGLPGTAVASAAAASPAAESPTMTDATKDQTRWDRYRAIYDETGKPLAISRTAYGAKEARSRRITGNDRADVRVGSGPVTATPDAEQPSVAFDPDDNTARPVGPQSFSNTVADFAARKTVKREVRSDSVITTITVTPLRRNEADGTAPSASPAPRAQQDEPGLAEADESVLPPGTAAKALPAETDG
ncbi:DUF2865 domain-containing protein [Acuticoccus sp. MNP-M23]|uniref:DUF2865 domain-containing protein n=1 Tax=Acuticoccus sp. MNP-M23 TaxID=3072793 RepID=UPI0028150A6E|nr:DUF2865 domain-containing protein [Acuticoccus sp. MNP-M23]WMS41227.1 DUF2865 domain-containing protein [Acuticoccus sp. MNP-M23]